MKIRNFLLTFLLVLVCAGCVVGAVLPSTSLSADVFAKAMVCAQEKASTMASTNSAARVNPAKTQDITTYDLYQTEDYRYATLDDGNLMVTGYSQIGYNKACEAIEKNGMFSMAMPRNSKVTQVASECFFYTTALRAYVEKLYIPSTMTLLKTVSFHYFENMTNLYFEDGSNPLVLEGQTFFGACSLKDLYIPARVQYWDLYDNPFALAKNLEHIYVHPDNKKLTSRDYKGNETDCVMAYKNYFENRGTYILSGSKNTKIADHVVGIGEQAFMYIEIENISLPQSIKCLEFEAFAGTKLKTLVLPKSIKDIGQAVIYDCRDLKSVVLPNSDCKMSIYGTDLDWMLRGTYALQCLVAADGEQAAEMTELFREYGHLVTYEIEVIYHFMDGHVETDKKLFARDLSWTLQEDGGWDVGTYALRPGTWADASGKELSYDDVNSLVSGGEVTSAINLYQTKLPDPVDPNDPDNPDKPVDPDNPGDDGKVEGQGSKSTNGVVKNLWWIIPLVIAAVALLVWAAFAVVAAITGVAGLAGFAALFAMIFGRHKNDEDDWLKRVLKIIRKKV